MSEPGKAMMGTASASGPDRATKAADMAVACPLLEGIDLSGARGVLVLIAANRNTFKLAESRNAMNTIRRYAADDAHVIYGTAYDESLGDQLRVTVIATGLSPAATRQQAPISMVAQAPVQRTGTDDLPIMKSMAVPRHNAGRHHGTPHGAGLQRADHAQRLAQRPHRGGGQGRCAGQQRHGRDRDPGVPAQAGGLMGRLERLRRGPRHGGDGSLRGTIALPACGTIPSMLQQRTLKSMTRAVGVGVHGGQRVELTLRPAPPDSGIVVSARRSAAAGGHRRRRRRRSATRAWPRRCRAGGDPGAPKVQTIEHLLSACAGLGLDNLVVDITAEEVPILDGSAASFVFLLQSAGIELQNAPKRFIRVAKTGGGARGRGRGA